MKQVREIVKLSFGQDHIAPDTFYVKRKQTCVCVIVGTINDLICVNRVERDFTWVLITVERSPGDATEKHKTDNLRKS